MRIRTQTNYGAYHSVKLFITYIIYMTYGEHVYIQYVRMSM